MWCQSQIVVHTKKRIKYPIRRNQPSLEKIKIPIASYEIKTEEGDETTTLNNGVSHINGIQPSKPKKKKIRGKEKREANYEVGNEDKGKKKKKSKRKRNKREHKVVEEVDNVDVNDDISQHKMVDEDQMPIFNNKVTCNHLV